MKSIFVPNIYAMFWKLFAVIMATDVALGLQLGRLNINGHKDKNDIELQSSVPKRVLVTSFTKTSILSAAANGSKTAKVLFTRDTKGEHNYAIVHEVANDQHLSHYSIEWYNPLPAEEFCIHIGGDQQWYSTYEEAEQRWPLNKQKNFKEPESLTTFDQFHHPIGGIIESLFLGSQGFGIYVDKSAPLFLRRDGNSQNPMLCFSGDYNKSPYNHAVDKKQTKIIVHLMTAPDIMQVYRYAAKQWIKKPQGFPDQRMIKSPIWSTWAKYHGGIDQNKVIEFAKEISSHGLPNSQLEIDDKWETHYGDCAFDSKKFPNPKQMVSQLKSMGYRTTLWVYPFVNTDSAVFHEAQQHFIKSQSHSVLVNDWWDGKGAHVDFTSKAAQDWFVSRLNHLRNTTGIDAFKFDAGELGWLNQDFLFSDKNILQTPTELTRLYAETAARLGNMIETRVGYDAQHLPIFIRMMDKLSGWDYNDGLRTLIPSALMMSIAGYPFVLPDMIGGNAYGNFPSKELYIRWLQVNTFMPTLQFSITPWDFKDSTQEVLNVTKAMLKLHEQYSPLIIKLAENAVKTGEPMMRPLWWVAPNDTNTFAIDDQFLVGNDLLVAPITHENGRKRDIYLPDGQWKDQKGTVHKGPQKLKDYPADLHELPYFTRV